MMKLLRLNKTKKIDTKNVCCVKFVSNFKMKKTFNVAEKERKKTEYIYVDFLY